MNGNEVKIDLGKPVQRRKKYRKGHRPMRGVGTFFILLLTSVFFGILSDKRLHKYTWIVALPVYGCSLLIYVAYLLFWHDDEEEEELLPIPILDIIHEHDLDLVHDKNLKEKRRLDHLSQDGKDNRATDVETRSIDGALVMMDNYISLGLSKVSQSFANMETFFRTNIRQRIRHPDECITSTLREENDDDSESNYDGHKSPVWCHGVDRFYSSEQPVHVTEISIVNLSGKYKLIHNHNFDAFLKSQNIPFLIRNAANQSRPVHTLTHDTTANTLRIQVDGITKGDTTYFIDGPPGSSSIRHLKFDDFVTYVDDGRAVQVRKVATNAPPNGAAELIIKRTLANEGNYLLLFSKARFQDGTESIESIQTFHRLDHQ